MRHGLSMLVTITLDLETAQSGQRIVEARTPFFNHSRRAVVQNVFATDVQLL
jgi:hypothetical protein